MNKRAGDGYENVSEYIKIGQPNISTLAKLDALEPTETYGDRELPSIVYENWNI